MKKLFLIAFAAIGMTAMAQHVTPLNIQIVDLKLDSLRALYIQEPTMYRASLDVVGEQLAQNAEQIKQAKAELKAEQTLAKEMDKSIKNANKMADGLKKLYAKEEGELKSMQKNVEQQQKTINKLKELNRESKDVFMGLMEQEQKELGYSLREAADRQRAIADLQTSLQNAQTNLQSYVQEVEQKATGLAQIEAEYKARLAALKNEQKAAKSMQ
ncbi:MAG: hypothetical protein IJ204_00605 [Paludibacteraceae bacterium]|nr:hypothetical protein [Paludibacteraceae bacterium]